MIYEHSNQYKEQTLGVSDDFVLVFPFKLTLISSQINIISAHVGCNLSFSLIITIYFKNVFLYNRNQPVNSLLELLWPFSPNFEMPCFNFIQPRFRHSFDLSIDE